MRDDTPPHPATAYQARQGQGDKPASPHDPHSLEAERECLAAVFVDNDTKTIDMLMDGLESADWYYDRHRVIFESMCHLRRGGTPIDPVTLNQHLVNIGQYEKLGGPRVVGELLDRAGTVSNVAHYMRTVQSKAVLRKTLNAARMVEAAALADVDDVEGFLLDAERTIGSALKGRDRLTRSKTWADACIANVEASMLGPDEIWPVKTGIDALDNYMPLRGWEPGWLVVVMCGPGVGKTSFALGNVARVTCEAGGGVVYFSAEMGQPRLNMRMLAGVSGVSSRAVKRGDMNREQQEAWIDAGTVVAEWPMEVYRTSAVEGMVAQLRAIKERGVGPNKAPLRLAVVDYIQRVRNGHKNGFDDIAHTMHTLQDAASEVDLGIPILALSQPSTEARRSGKKTTGADAKGSGAIEEDCDLFIVIHRGVKDRDAIGMEIVKGRDLDPYEWHAEDVVEKGTVRFHACGWRWDKKHMRFVEGGP